MTGYWDTTTDEILEKLSPLDLEISRKQKLVNVNTDFQESASKITRMRKYLSNAREADKHGSHELYHARARATEVKFQKEKTGQRKTVVIIRSQAKGQGLNDCDWRKEKSGLSLSTKNSGKKLTGMKPSGTDETFAKKTAESMNFVRTKAVAK